MYCGQLHDRPFVQATVAGQPLQCSALTCSSLHSNLVSLPSMPTASLTSPCLQDFGITTEHIEALYQYAKFQVRAELGRAHCADR